MIILKKGYTLSVGKHGKIILDPTTHTIHFHSQRAIREMQTLFAVSADIKGIMKEVIDELYSSGRITDFNVLELESHLLVHENSYRRFLREIEEYLPKGTQMIEIPVHPIRNSIKWTVRFVKAWRSFTPFSNKKKSKNTQSDATRGVRIILPRINPEDDI